MNEYLETEIKHIKLKKARILLRVDFNIPLKPINTKKIEEIIPTIKGIINEVYSITIISHYKRPECMLFTGTGIIYQGPGFNYIFKKYSLIKVFFIILSKFKIFKDLKFNKFENRGKNFCDENYVDDSNIPTKNIELLENTRLYNLKKEDFIEINIEKNKYRIYDLYIFDSFSSIHRDVIEMNIFPQIYGSSVVNGLEYCEVIINRKFDILFLGGDKIDKLIASEYLMNQKTTCYLMGKLGLNMQLKINQNIYETNWKNIILPKDYILYDGTIIDCIKLNYENRKLVRDIGPKTISLYANQSYYSKRVLFNGTPGVFEEVEYSKGTIGLLKILNKMCENNSCVFIIGAHTNSAVNHFSNSIDIKYLKKSIYKNQAGGAIMSIIMGTKEVLTNFKSLKIDLNIK